MSAERGWSAGSCGGCGRGPHDGGCRVLAAARVDLDDLADELPEVGEVTATTDNGSAVLTQVGRYARVGRRGRALEVSGGRIGLRAVAAQVREGVVMAPDERTALPTALHLFGRSGAAVHRLHVRDEDGQRDRLASLVMRCAPPEHAVRSRVEAPRVDWADADQLDHLDAIADDGGSGRDLSAERVRRADPDEVVTLLEHVVHCGLPVTVGVGTPGVLQLYRGVLGHVEERRRVVHGAAHDAAFAYDPARVVRAQVVSAHGVRGPASAVELLDRRGRCVLVVAQTGLRDDAVDDEWEHAVAHLRF